MLPLVKFTLVKSLVAYYCFYASCSCPLKVFDFCKKTQLSTFWNSTWIYVSSVFEKKVVVKHAYDETNVPDWWATYVLQITENDDSKESKAEKSKYHFFDEINSA